MKRVCSITLIIVMIMTVLSPTVISNATDVTVANTFGDIAYGYTADDLLFEINYTDYFNVDTNKQYLKYCSTYESYYVHNNNSDMGSNIMTNMINSWDNNTYLQDTTFPDDLEGVHISQLYYYDYVPHLANMVIESDDLIIINGTLCSSQPFRYHIYYYDIVNAGSSAYSNLTDYGISTYNTINNDGFYSVNMSNRVQWNLYSEVPVYFTAMKNVSYPEGDFLVDDYNYDSITNIYDAVVNNTDDTGFVVDRRTQHMIDETTGGGSNVNPSQYGFKQNSFGNILYGDNTTSQYLMVGYELNDISKTIGDKLYLKLNYRYLFSGLIHGVSISFDEAYYDNVQKYDLYPLNNNNYINVDLSNKIFPLLLETDSTFETNYAALRDVWEFSNNGSASPYAQKPVPVSCDQMLYDFTTEHILTGYSMPVEYDTNFFKSVSLSYKGVTVSPTFNINTLWDGEFNGSYENRIDSAQIIVTESIYNAETGEESSPCTFIYDYLYGSYEGIGTLETIGEQLPSDKYTYGGQSLGYSSKELGYNLATGDFYSSSQGGSASATGNVVNVYAGTQGALAIVDMTSEEWMKHSPNFAELITIIKNGITSVNEDSGSVVMLLSESYDVFPTPIWTYLSLAIAVIASLSIIRYIRRG